MKIFLTTLLSFSFQISNGAISRVNLFADSVIVSPKKDYRLNESEFLAKYGKDDSSRALIKYFFYKRKSAVRMIYLPLAFGVAVTTGIGIISLNTVVSLNFPLLIPLGLAIGSIITLEIIATTRLLFVSRKALLHKIDNYYAGKGIPKRISDSKSFMAFLNGTKTINRHHIPKKGKGVKNLLWFFILHCLPLPPLI